MMNLLQLDQFLEDEAVKKQHIDELHMRLLFLRHRTDLFDLTRPMPKVTSDLWDEVVRCQNEIKELEGD
jgi:hypothetical protein